jgi:SAM-dependent methyltransferase
MPSMATILLVAPTALSFLHLIHRLERRGCRWLLATSWEEAERLLTQEPCDLVLTMESPRTIRFQDLKESARGHLPTVFQAVPVEDSSWWVPVLEEGRPTTNLRALRPAEFASYLERLLDQLCGTGARTAETPSASAVTSSETEPSAVAAKTSK